MKIEIQYEKKPHSRYGEPKIEKPYELFAEWLVSDVQRDVLSVDSLLQYCDDIRAGKCNKIEADGNAYIATIELTGVSLLNMYTDQKSEKKLELTAFESLLLDWRKHLRRRR